MTPDVEALVAQMEALAPLSTYGGMFAKVVAALREQARELEQLKTAKVYIDNDVEYARLTGAKIT